MFPTLSVARTECRLQFGREYLIPKPFDPRVLMWEASAVAEAAMQTGAAQEPVDLDTYRAELERRLGKAYQVSRAMIHKAQVNPKQVVFPEGENEKILRACHMLAEERIGNPILLGDAEKIRTRAREFGVDLAGMEIIDPATSEHREAYVLELFRLRQRRGVTLNEAEKLMNDRNVFGSMMVRMGDADALCLGCDPAFPRYDSSSVADCPDARRVASSLGMLCHHHTQGRSVFPG